MSESSTRPPISVLGIWIGSPAKLPPLAREGIFRFVFNLVQGLAAYDSLRVEIWCQRVNEANVRALFAPLQHQAWFRQRVVFRTEFDPGGGRRIAARLSHWSRVAVFGLKDLISRHRRAVVFAAGTLGLLGLGLLVALAGPMHPAVILPVLLLAAGAIVAAMRGVRGFFKDLATHVWEGFKRVGNFLPSIASRQSEAQCFLVQNLDLENCLRLDRPKVVCLHDLYTSEFAALFGSSSRNERLRYHGQRAARAGEELAKAGTVFVSNSDHIRRTHALKLIKGLDERQTAVVLLPGPVPPGIRERVPPADMLLNQFGISRPYLFYATHVRPYKNVVTLLKALAIVREHGHDVQLVLTGSLSHDRACVQVVERAGLTEAVISTGELSESEMFGLYRYATLVAVPTLSEGGFPWQAIEAMVMDVPVILSRIPVVLERLQFHGFAPETSGLRLFDPMDEQALARSIVEVMTHREQVLLEQRPVRDALASYGWTDVARQYYEILGAAVKRSAHV